jgi:hypothetical protein
VKGPGVSFNPFARQSMEALPFPLSSRPERSEVEGSAVQRTSRGNVFNPDKGVILSEAPIA